MKIKITQRIEFRPYFYTNWAGLPLKKYIKIFLFNIQKNNSCNVWVDYQLRVLGFTFAYRIYT